VARSVAVHAAGIVEALTKIYGAQGLVRELRMAGARRPTAAAAKKPAAQ
jgi:hypothetical protein